jgi:FAD dependent oxidoreductase TIGR03364
VSSSSWDVVVVGAGVIGTFHAYFACRRGLRTLLLERGDLPGEASVRNFGMVVPSAMKPGDWHRRGVESANLYRLLAEQVPLAVRLSGTQYLATTPAEQAVLQEFASLGPSKGYGCELLDARQSVSLNPVIDPGHCLASLHCPGDLCIEPRALFGTLIPWMVRKLNCVYLPRTVAVGVTVAGKSCRVATASGEAHEAEHVFVCTGADLRTLFPDRFAASGLVPCKLQMLRTEVQPDVRLPSSLASGLTLRRYPAFRLSPSWSRLEQEPVDPELASRGIHVLVVQDARGSLVIGDSHEYSSGDVDERLDSLTEALILREAGRLMHLPNWQIAERWHGVYTLHPEQEVFDETLDGRIHLLTGIGGKGMTTGPALARESIDRIR